MVKTVTGWPKFQIRTISNFSETKSGEPVAQLPVFINTISGDMLHKAENTTAVWDSHLKGNFTYTVVSILA